MEGSSNLESSKIGSQRRAEYFRALMEELAAAGGSMRNPEARKRLAARLSFSDYEREIGKNRMERWWTDLTLQFIAFSKARWLERHKGMWRITEAGLEKLRTTTARQAFEEAQQAYRDWKEAEQDEEGGEIVGEEPEAQRVWLIGAGPSAAWWADFQRERRVFVEFPSDGDGKPFGRLDEMSKDQIRSRMVKVREVDNPMHDVHCAWQFAHEMEPGDLVIVRKGRSVVIGHGVVRGGYECLDIGGTQRHCRVVEWSQVGEVRLPDKYLTPSKTLTEIGRYAGFADVMLGRGTADARQSLLTTIGMPVEEQDAYFRAHPFAEAAPQDSGSRSSSPSTVPSLDDIAEDAFVDRGFLQDVLQAIERKRAIVLQGPPGTGKTWLARRIAQIWARDPHLVMAVQFHAAYQYEDFVRGMRPGPSGQFQVEDGPLIEIANRAKANTDKRYVLLIDEINRANVAKVLGETLSLVEHDKRSAQHAVQLGLAVGGQRDFWIPENLAIVATMNTADRSIALVDFALRRRFSFFTLKPAFEVGGRLESWLLSVLGGVGDSDGSATDPEARATKSEARTVTDAVIRTMTEINRRISESKLLGDRFVLGHSYFCGRRDVDRPSDWMRRVFREEILPMLQEYGADHRSLADSLKEPLLPILGSSSK